MKGLEEFKKKLLLEKSDGTEAITQKNDWHDALLRHAKKLIDISRKEMGKHYSTWDYMDQVFRSRRVLDKEDRSANAKGQPAKLIVPLQFSQIMTFVSFSLMTVLQNKRFFQLEQTRSDSHVIREACELVLERDCKKNTWATWLTQFFLDIGRFGLGAAEVGWKEEVRFVKQQQTKPVIGAFGTEGDETTESYIPIPTFVGNKIYPVSPYRFFPDTRLPLSRFQEGEFCGSEDMFTFSTLKSDPQGLFNVDVIPKMTKNDYEERRKSTRIDVMDFIPTRSQNGGDAELGTGEGFVRDGQVVITKLVVDIVPKNFKLEDERVLGDEDFPLRYILWYANDKTIVRFDEATYLHCQFPYISAQYLPDQQKTINEGLADVCDQITNTITWLINAAITGKRSGLDGKFLVDPAGVDIKSIESRSPYIFLKRNASNMGVDRYIKQFTTQDYSGNYMQEAGSLQATLEGVTGWSAQMQGQYSSGRRSATQDRVVAQGASARGKSTLASVWDSAFQALGKQLLTNNRQEMDFDTFSRILGPGPFGEMKDTPIEVLYAMFQSDPMSLAMCEDFFVYDGTLPSEKAFLAQSLQEILGMLLQNLTISQVLGYGPAQVREIFNDVYELRGVTPPSLPAPNPMPPPSNVTPMLPSGAPAAEPPVPAVPSNG